MYLKIFSGFIFPCYMSSITGVSSFFCEGPGSKSRGFVGHVVPVTTEWAQLCSRQTSFSKTGRGPDPVCRLWFADPCPVMPAHLRPRFPPLDSPLFGKDRYQRLFGFTGSASDCGDSCFLNITEFSIQNWKEFKRNLLLGRTTTLYYEEPSSEGISLH